MSMFKLSHRINPLPYLLRNAQYAAFRKFRYMSEGLGFSNYVSAGTRRQHGYCICGVNSISDFSKRPLTILPLHSECAGGSFFLLSARRHYTYHNIRNTLRKNNSEKTLLYTISLAFVMIGLTYASVPLYRTFCQVTGYAGTVKRIEKVEDKIARHSKDGTLTSREIVVEFNADVSDGLEWKFTPTQHQVKVKLGESALAFFTAENCSSTPITGVSTYNIVPMKAAPYFNKVQCFCFEEQCLLPGEQIDMPVFFYIDPELEKDPRMKGLQNVMLSYTFFRSGNA